MPFEKKAVHFGGGNIGRGFVAEFLHESGYEVVFIDVVDAVIEKLQKTPSYTVTEIGEDGERKFTIDHYRALNSKYEMDKVVEEIASADVVTCAVGPNILKFIAEPVAKAITARKVEYPLAVIACENMINATTAWRGFIEGKLDDSVKKDLSSKARFANSAIDRIVPNQPADAGLDVKIEKFYEWCVESTPFANGGKQPEIKGVHFVENLEPYIERKLFTVNTSHATAAYYGYQKGYSFIHEVLADKEIQEKVRSVIKETAHLIVTKHKVDQKEQDSYVEAIIKRISNPALEDNVTRVGRAPLRKLGLKERFISPASQLVDRGVEVPNLLGAIEQGFKFRNVEGDDESAKLDKIIKENDAKAITAEVTGLEESHPLFAKVQAVVEKVKSA